MYLSPGIFVCRNFYICICVRTYIVCQHCLHMDLRKHPDVLAVLLTYFCHVQRAP